MYPLCEHTSIIGQQRWKADRTQETFASLHDEETLELLATVPREYPFADEPLYGSPYWVKMVEAEPKAEQPFRVHLFGEFGLEPYWFNWNITRNVAEMLGVTDPQDSSIRYYGIARPAVPAELLLPGFPSLMGF
ncbi:hypothetical protein EsH8_VII_000070 [Colletotrichum jinshuiense]